MSGQESNELFVPKPYDAQEEERQHFHRIVNAFKYYRTNATKRVLAAEEYYNALPAHHRKMIPEFKSHLMKVKASVDHNSEMIKLIISHTDHMFENTDHGPLQQENSPQPASEFDMDKVKSTIKQIARDWSVEGKEERDACYKPVLDQIEKLFPLDKVDCTKCHILVPGSGLGRLSFEIAKRGYACQGNEFSLFMLFVSNFILNQCKAVDIFTIYPWVHQYCNNKVYEDQIRPITFPDLNPCDLPPHANFSMAAGDFLEVYKDPDSWDCIATVFFLDTAHNVLAYIETIYHILKPGGYWINLGPLLYHFADMPNESSIELSYADVMNVVKKFNFEIIREETDLPVSYSQNPRSMLRYQYECGFFVARKPENSEASR